MLATALWAASGAAVAGGRSPWRGPRRYVFDALRYAIWFAFLGSLLKGAAPGPPRTVSRSASLPRWVVALLAGAASSRRSFSTAASRSGATLDSQSRTGDVRHPARARRRRIDPRRAIAAPRTSAGALGDQAAVRRSRRACSASISSSSPTRCCFGVLDPDIWIARADCQRADHSVHRRSDRAEHRVDDRDARVARRRLSIDRTCWCRASSCSLSPAPVISSATSAATGDERCRSSFRSRRCWRPC